DMRDVDARNTRLGRLGRNREKTHKCILGHLGRKRAKDTVRANRPKMEQFAQSDLGHLGQKVP
ncbi:hypothetical protein KI387_010933, partial [Taxus chinensis]